MNFRHPFDSGESCDTCLRELNVIINKTESFLLLRTKRRVLERSLCV